MSVIATYVHSSQNVTNDLIARKLTVENVVRGKYN